MTKFRYLLAFKGEFDWGYSSKGHLLGSYYYGYIITQVSKISPIILFHDKIILNQLLQTDLPSNISLHWKSLFVIFLYSIFLLFSEWTSFSNLYIDRRSLFVLENRVQADVGYRVARLVYPDPPYPRRSQGRRIRTSIGSYLYFFRVYLDSSNFSAWFEVFQ